jgi:hypothetical protein
LQPESLSPLDRRLAKYSVLTALGVVVFSVLDVPLRSVALKGFYVDFSPQAIVVLMGFATILASKWESPLLLVILPSFCTLLSVPTISVLAVLVALIVGAAFLVALPGVVLVSMVGALIAIRRGTLRQVISHPVFVQTVSILILLGTVFYIHYFQSNGTETTLHSHQSISSRNYYLTTWKSPSSPVQVRLYDCNSLSIACNEIYRDTPVYYPQNLRLRHSKNKLIIVIGSQRVAEIPISDSD